MPPSSIPSVAAVDKKERQKSREVVSRRDGKQVVATPWQPEGVEGGVRLRAEVDKLGELMRLTKTEERWKAHVSWALSDAAAKSNYHVESIDDFFTTRVLPQPPGSVLVCSHVLYGFTELGGPAFFKHLNSNGVETRREPHDSIFVTLKHFSFEAVLCLAPSKYTSALGISKMLEKYPSAVNVFTAVWLVLHQSRCNLPETGGLSAEALMVLVLFCCTKTANSDDSGQVFVDFFAVYGSSLEGFVQLPNSPHPTSPLDSPCYVSHPQTGENLTPSLARHVQITAIFRHCSETIAKWSGAFYTGYRGRTPLSSILAYDHLWARVDLIAAEKKAEAAEQSMAAG